MCTDSILYKTFIILKQEGQKETAKLCQGQKWNPF